MPASSTTHEVLITATEDGLANLDGLVQRLAAKGLTDGSALSNVGVITGNASSDALHDLRSVPGVASLELAGGVQLPPPDADVQ